MSGVLVTLMASLVMPILSVTVARWLAGGRQTRPALRGPAQD
jgi:antibiotic biosynthesis monooxygenase (ABM) superfamily enzyme